MATGKSYYARPNNIHRFLNPHGSPIVTSPDFELTESDIWNSGASADFRKSSSGATSGFKIKRKPSSRRSDEMSSVGGGESSLPLDVPDWSKILRGEYRKEVHEFDDDVDEEEVDCQMRMPPHEFLMARNKNRTASFSVHEGVGRTLKGRDLSRVRNAIWEKTGFED